MGTYGILGSYVLAQGVDQLVPAPQSRLPAGTPYTSFEGDFSDASGAFEGNYEQVVAGLAGEPSVWQRNQFYLNLYDEGTNNTPRQ